jgi:hypothetical protein
MASDATMTSPRLFDQLCILINRKYANLNLSTLFSILGMLRIVTSILFLGLLISGINKVISIFIRNSKKSFFYNLGYIMNQKLDPEVNFETLKWRSLSLITSYVIAFIISQ